MNWTGGCLCGEVRFEAGMEPKWISHCHCSMCRKHTGAPLGTYVLFPAGSVRWLGREPTRYRSSKDVERSFCPVCGSTVGFHRVHETSLAIGGFDRPQDVVASHEKCVHVCYQERIAWFDTTDNWTRFDQFGPGREDEVRSLSGQPIRG